jgi:hypothetical protein
MEAIRVKGESGPDPAFKVKIRISINADSQHCPAAIQLADPAF